MKKFKKAVKIISYAFLTAFVILLGIFIATVVSNVKVIEKNIEFQEEHIE